MFQRFSAETKGLIKTAISLSYFMRGGLQYHDAFDLVPVERDMIDEFITKHIENERKNSHYPQY